MLKKGSSSMARLKIRLKLLIHVRLTAMHIGTQGEHKELPV
uniref:Uncharacterized protein n=1 Tax=Rhizophora mucronata TaxID=61149 RepID=A0A2P2PML1_RHIMU